MNKFMHDIAPAIAKIDGCCTVCIESFIARCYLIQPFVVPAIVADVNKHIQGAGITINGVEDKIVDIKFQEEET